MANQAAREKGSTPNVQHNRPNTGGGGGKTLVLALTATLAIIAGLLSLNGVSEAQNDDEQTGRIVARRLDDGRTEFGWQPNGGERILPRLRYFPTDAPVDRWLNSSPVEVDDEEIGRINARQSEDGRIEFAFTPTDGERILPPSRYFPTDAQVGRWLRSTEIAISAPPATGFVAISAASGYACALRASGEIECWGHDIAAVNNGVFSTGTLDAPSGEFRAVSAGSQHACAIRTSGEIECWGGDHYEEIEQPPLAEPPAGRFHAVSAGDFHSCGLRESGEIVCWGSVKHRYGNPNDEEYEIRTHELVTPPAGPFTAVSVSAGACAIRESGEIECWSVFGQGSDIPTGRFSAVSASLFYTCGLRTDGAIYCWGRDPFGVGLLDDIPAGRFSAVSAGNFHNCGLREAGEIECWGDNEQEQSDAPAGRFSAVSAGDFHSCALRDTGEIECWGQIGTPAP